MEAVEHQPDPPTDQHDTNGIQLKNPEPLKEAFSGAKDTLTSATSRPLFVEIFAGAGNLSKHMYQRGFDVICIDWKHNKHTSKFSAINVDLSCDDGQQVLWALLDNLKPHALHAGVACGTSSRAREKELPASLRRQGAPPPVPLRDDEHWDCPDFRPSTLKRLRQPTSFTIWFSSSFFIASNTTSSFPSRIPGDLGCGRCWS